MPIVRLKNDIRQLRFVPQLFCRPAMRSDLLLALAAVAFLATANVYAGLEIVVPSKPCYGGAWKPFLNSRSATLSGAANASIVSEGGMTVALLGVALLSMLVISSSRRPMNGSSTWMVRRSHTSMARVAHPQIPNLRHGTTRARAKSAAGSAARSRLSCNEL